jgi:hypothetical protein
MVFAMLLISSYLRIFPQKNMVAKDASGMAAKVKRT